MAAYLLDTDIVIYWLTDRFPHIQQRIDAVDAGDIFLSAITVAELYFGAWNSSRPRENRELIDELLSYVTVLDFDHNAAFMFGRVKAELKQSGRIVNDSDLLISATALFHSLILVTNNERHFERIPDLRIENWIAE
jgi:tRNA(fMet)-specific endonuclease VapC